MLDREQVAKKVRAAVVEAFDLTYEISDDALSLKDDLDANSLDLVSLAFVLEDEFSAEIEDEQVEHFKTIENVIDYIMARQEKNELSI